jgi:hypothetical protein
VLAMMAKGFSPFMVFVSDMSEQGSKSLDTDQLYFWRQ